MRIFLVGLACTLLGATIVFVAGCSVFAVLYLPSHPVVDWLVTDPYTLAHSVAFFWDGEAVTASLLIGLCIVAPLAPQVATGAPGTRGRIFFVLALVTGQLAIFALLAAGEPAVTRLRDWPTLATAAVVPGLAATAVSLALFSRFATRRRSANSRKTDQPIGAGAHEGAAPR